MQWTLRRPEVFVNNASSRHLAVVVAASFGAILLASACSSDQALGAFCESSTSCTCTSNSCCVNPGFQCEAGSDCCAGSTCVGQRCVANADDSGTGGGAGGGVGAGGGTGGGAGGGTGTNFRLVIDVADGGGGAGRVNLGAFSCVFGQDCVTNGVAGTSLLLEAFPSRTSGFVGFTGGCAPVGDFQCSVTFDGGPQQVNARFVPLNVAFVTSTKFASPTVLLSDAGMPNFICQKHAADAGLSGTFVAWFPNGAVTALDNARVVINNPGPFMTTRGELIADSLSDLTTRPISSTFPHYRYGQKIRVPIRYTEHGIDARSTDFDNSVFTATDVDGTRQNFCATGTITTGSLVATTDDWTYLNNYTCSTTTARLYCLQVDFSARARPAPATGNLAFVSREVTVPRSSLAAMDQFCADDARDAGFTGTFQAFLATGDAGLSDRFSAISANFVRVDGVLLGTLSELSSGARAPLNVNSKGQYVQPDVWTGARTFADPGNFSTTCEGWTRTAPLLDGGRLAINALSNHLSFQLDQQSDYPCSDQLATYCVQTAQ